MENKTTQSTIVAEYFENLSVTYELSRKELKNEQRALVERTDEEHQSIIDALRLDAPPSQSTENIARYIANLAERAGLRGQEKQIRRCAIAAKIEQRDWWHKYGEAKKYGFRDSQKLDRDIKKLKSVRNLVEDPGYRNALTLVSASDAPASERQLLLQTFPKLCRKLETATEAAIGELPNMGHHTRYDLRLMVLAPQAFWDVHKPRQAHQCDRPLEQQSAWFVHEILWLVDRSVTKPAIKCLSRLAPSHDCLGMQNLKEKFENYRKSFETMGNVREPDPTESLNHLF